MAMNDAIRAAAELCKGPQGESFLRLMAKAYSGTDLVDVDKSLTRFVVKPQELGLIRRNGSLTLTSAGFLIANVAKEYCQYLDDGRSLAPPKPSPEMIAG